jgi:hypothetical protein
VWPNNVEEKRFGVGGRSGVTDSIFGRRIASFVSHVFIILIACDVYSVLVVIFVL